MSLIGLANDRDLNQFAEVFVQAFRAALLKNKEDFHSLLGSGKGFSSGVHGTVAFTDDLIAASRNLSTRAVKVFGSSRIHQKSAEEVARSVAFTSSETDSAKQVAKAIIQGICSAAATTYRIIRPNPLFRLAEDVMDLSIGPVRITHRENLHRDIAKLSSKLRIVPLTEERNAYTLIADGSILEDAEIHLPDVCWDVSVQGMPKGLELQALWFIDVAISFVRLHCDEPRGLFPRIEDIEPHPIYPRRFYTPGLSIGPNGPEFGGGSLPPWYELDINIANILSSSKVARVAQQVFAPGSNTLAERMQQALGWLTRARRAHEPAERVLLFFTAIEALLSGGGKDGPVTDSIARYAGVIWSERPETRLSLYASLKKHYDLRSRIVHNGERSVAQIEVNNVHYIAWTITQILLRRADLTVKHSDFVETLKKASFGTKLEI